jgi:pSer/pThr/pTyr-binding forkhead associated (FHA) protein
MNTMRLHFPQSEREDVLLGEGETSIGSGSGCNVPLQGEGVQDLHVIVTADARGPILWVRSPGNWTHVNGRPVQEKAILRVGDCISLGAVGLVLRPDTDSAISNALPPAITPEDDMKPAGQETRYRNSPPKALLRGVSGPYFGKVIGIPGRLVIGRGDDADLVLDEPEMSRRHALIEVTVDSIYLRDLGSANGTYVNDVQVRDALLYSGDQIAFDRNRFLIEAPGMRTRPDGAAEAQRSLTPELNAHSGAAESELRPELAAAATSGDPASSPPTAGRSSPWLPLLIGAAIAAALTLLLFGLQQ